MIVALATIAFGVTVRVSGSRLGTATPPFVAGWSPRVDPLLAVTLAVLALAPPAAARLLSPRLPPAAFAAAAFALASTAGLALNVARTGVSGWSAIFDLGPGGSWEAPNEYLPGLSSLGYGVWFYLDRFAELVPSQPVNVAGHPPGPLLLVHALGIDGAGGLAALCIGVGAAAAPLTYALARTLGRPEPVARVAALLLALSPIVLLDATTSFDAVYMTAGALAAGALVARRAAPQAAGAVLAAGAAFLSWALLGVAAWAVLVVLRRDGARRAALLAGGCALALVALNGALALAYGYDAIGTLRATEAVYRNSAAMFRPYAYWLLGSPTAWGVMLGLPLAAAAIRAAVRRDPAAVALAAVIAIAAVGGFTKAETERIWLIFVPAACVAAAPVVGPGRLRAVLVALVVQALVTQVLFETLW